MAREHQEYCETKVYPLVERLVTKTLMERPDLPVPFMLKCLAKETNRIVPTKQLLMLDELRELQAQISELEVKLDAVPSASSQAHPALATAAAAVPVATDSQTPTSSASSPVAVQQGGAWGFTFGPELDVEELECKRGVRILESVGASAKGWRLAFRTKGIPLVEPAFATVVRGIPADEVHGLAFRVPPAQLAALDAAEPGCERAAVQLTAYDGRCLCGFVYTARSHALVPEAPPSGRHLQSLLMAAKKARLSAAYTERLAVHPTYKPSAATLKARASLPAMEDLEEVTCDELAGMADEDEVCHVSCLGYVVRVPKAKIYVGSHRGKDITARVLREWRGLPPDKVADQGRPPYPGPSEMSREELEFARQWLDHYLWAGGGAGCVVGFLSELRQQRELEALHLDVIS